MDNEINLITKLAHLNSNETVKVAGLLRRLKNWFKGWSDPVFKQSVLDLAQKSKNTQEILNYLSKEINAVQSAISETDLLAYEIHFNILKELAVKLINEINSTQDTISKTEEKIKEKSDLNSKLHYSAEDLQEGNFLNKFKQMLPDEYDIPLNQILKDKPIKTFKYYANITPDWIVFTEGTKQYLIDQLLKKLNLNTSDASKLIQNIKEGIINGKLINSSPKELGRKNNQKQEWGTLDLTISSAPFLIPDTDILVTGTFILIDKSTALSRSKKLSVRASFDLRIVHVASYLYKIKKYSEQVSPTFTKLNDVELANIMRKGYQLAFGEDPTMEVLAGGWAQAALENGLPAVLPNNNIGNIRADTNWIKSNKAYFTNKIDTGSTTTSKWRAHSSPEEGAADYWLLLKNQMPEVINLMAQKDPIGAGIALGQKHYYVAPIKTYSSALNKLYNEFFNKIANQLPNLKYNDNTIAPAETQSLPSSTPSNDTDVDQLMNQLVASKLTSLVKRSLLKKTEPSQILVKVMANSNIIETEFASKLAFILQKYVNAKTQICGLNDQTELQIISNTSLLPSLHSIQALADILSDQLLRRANIKIETWVVPNLKSQYPPVELNKIAQNSNSFNKIIETINGN